MLDTSALLPALVTNHALHESARASLPRPGDARLPGIVLAETFARLRGAPFRVSAGTAIEVLSPWTDRGEILETPSPLYRRAFADAPQHNLGGQVHDYLIVLTCLHHGCDLVTADRRQADLARLVLEPASLAVTLLRGA